MAIYSIPQDLFPWERGLGTRKAPPQLQASVNPRCYILAAEEALEETPQSNPERRAAGRGRWGRAGRRGRVRRATSPRNPSAYPTPLSSLAHLLPG